MLRPPARVRMPPPEVAEPEGHVVRTTHGVDEELQRVGEHLPLGLHISPEQGSSRGREGEQAPIELLGEALGELIVCVRDSRPRGRPRKEMEI